MKLLLLSNSYNYGQGLLDHAEDAIRDFLGTVKRALFVPYAVVSDSYDRRFETVSARFREFGYELDSIHLHSDPIEAINRAEAIVTCGGNTFHLLYQLYKNNLLEPMREVIKAGVPYIGWSAGANIACPTIKTTNDMPIVFPGSFDALNLVPFQINPHYINYRIPGHQGETRDMRLEEFLALNPGVYVLGLREGSMLRVEGRRLTLLGDKPLKVFFAGGAPTEYSAEDDINFLLNP
ncbi:MAG: dipeptidase PepE [Acidobacteriota bacterium]|nr:dipeptidase PepE [Blastocatellia bacterium]MDW8412928.1 dipeptidase PepE [Acidobacteriota bacterium]